MLTRLSMSIDQPNSTWATRARAFPGKQMYRLAMRPAFRRFVTRACMVCDWSGESVEQAPRDLACPDCHAPTRVAREELLVPMTSGKNPIGSALGRLGGSKGGKTRAERLSSTRRREIARAAAQARWKRR